ncbi:MAG TPA: hypothetical protein VJ437_06255 [Acidiferrobacterales bacterium]|nr:hypothetical protein [Acidiferrobacterales bacterium]
MRKLIVLMLLVVTTTGCVSAIKAKMERITPTTETMAGIKTIQVIDKTDPLILQGTDAGMIAEFIQTAIKGKGYEPCKAPCQADATATVNVTEFARKTRTGPMFYPGVATVTPMNVMIFTFQILDKSGAVVMNHTIRHGLSTEQRDLAVIGVQELAGYIPAAK